MKHIAAFILLTVALLGFTGSIAQAFEFNKFASQGMPISFEDDPCEPEDDPPGE